MCLTCTPGIAAYILCNGVRVGSFGKLANDVQAGLDLPRDSRANQKIFLGEIDYETLVAQLPAGLRYHPLPEFDTVARDLALVADEETPCGTIIAEMKRACKQLADVELFDIYRSEAIGAGKKEHGVHLALCTGKQSPGSCRCGPLCQENPRQPQVQAGHRDPLNSFAVFAAARR